MSVLVGLGEAMGELRETTSGMLNVDFSGDVFNTLVYAAALGGPGWAAQFVSAVGDDTISQRFCERSISLGVLPRVTTMQGGSLGLYMISTDRVGERSFRYWRSQSPARRCVANLSEDQRSAIRRGTHVLVSGITLAILDDDQRAQLADLMAALRVSGAQIVFDPNFRPVLWESVEAARYWVSRFYELSTIALPGMDDERAMFGLNDPEQVLSRKDLADTPTVVVKAGPRGAFARVDGLLSQAEFVAPKIPVDTTAAGDGFNAAWLVGIESGLRPDAALRFASNVAAAIAAHSGAIAPAAALPTLHQFEDTP